MTTRRLLIVTAILAISSGLRSWLAASPLVPARQPLAEFPRQLGSWQMAGEGSIPPRLEAVVAADDYVLRTYRDSDGRSADLFVSYYRVKTERAGPHSPKNCLPGSGWEPVQYDRIRLGSDVSGRPTWANRYIVEKNGDRDLVLYWYQDHGRVIASEYWGMVYTIWDALRTRRRDGALVRVVVPVARDSNETAETATALDFAQAALPHLPRFIPD